MYTCGSTLSLLGATETLNSGNTTYSIRTGPTSSVDSSWTSWTEVTNGSDPATSLDNNRYAQIKVDLTGTGLTTPDIESLSLTYTEVVAVADSVAGTTTSVTSITTIPSESRSSFTITPTPTITEEVDNNEESPKVFEEEATTTNTEGNKTLKYVIITISSITILGLFGFVIRRLLVAK